MEFIGRVVKYDARFAGLRAPTVTFTAQEAVKPPSTVVTWIVALPTAKAVTKPLWFTDAALPATLHVTALLVALVGKTVALNVSVLPMSISSVVLFRVTPVTGIGALTVTAQDAVKPPSTVVTMIVALPVAKAVTKPLADTEAKALPPLHVTFLLVALEGKTAAINVSVAPMLRVRADLFSVTPVTGICTIGGT
jgi:hypothetical protein